MDSLAFLGQYQFKVVDYYINNDRDTVKDCLKYFISEKKLPIMYKEKPPKITYSLLKSLFLVID